MRPAVLLAVLMLAGPATADPDNTPRLEGGRWVFVGGMPATSHFGVAEVQFAGANVRGFLGCNWVNGHYVAGADGSIHVQEMQVTRRACTPRERMQAELRFGRALRLAARYEIHDGRLSLRSSDGVLLADFRRCLDGVCR